MFSQLKSLFLFRSGLEIQVPERGKDLESKQLLGGTTNPKRQLWSEGTDIATHMAEVACNDGAQNLGWLEFPWN